MANYVPFAVRVGVVNQEASLTAGLGKPPANLVWLCEVLRLGAFFLRLLIALALKGDSAYFGESELHSGRQ